MKLCKNCGTVKESHCFFASKLTKDGLMSPCKACRKANHLRNYTTAKGRKHNLQAHYGLEIEDYNRLHARQNGCCALCGRPENQCATKTQHKLFVDHDHTTKRIRGLLCLTCNNLIAAVEKYLVDKAKVDQYLQDGAEYGVEEPASSG